EPEERDPRVLVDLALQAGRVEPLEGLEHGVGGVLGFGLRVTIDVDELDGRVGIHQDLEARDEAVGLLSRYRSPQIPRQRAGLGGSEERQASGRDVDLPAAYAIECEVIQP